jgi:hypothetical protein
MQRILITTGWNGEAEKHPYLKFFEDMFRKFGKAISENEVVFTYGCNFNECMNKNPLPLTMLNAYDRIKYISGYSRDIIPVLARVEISSNASGDECNNGDIIPLDILEKSAIMSLVSDGYLPVVIPDFTVIKELQYYSYSGEIVDIYSTSSLLATLIEADNFIIILDRQFNTDNIEILKNIKFDNLKKLYDNKFFKEYPICRIIKAMIDFIYKGGKKATLISPDMCNIIDLENNH